MLTAAAKLRVGSALFDETLGTEQAEMAAAEAEASVLLRLQLDVKQEESEKDQADRVAAALRQEIAASRAADGLDAIAYYAPVSDFSSHVFDQSLRMSEEMQTKAQNLGQKMQQVVAMRDNGTGGGDAKPVVPDSHTAPAEKQAIEELESMWNDFDENQL